MPQGTKVAVAEKAIAKGAAKKGLKGKRRDAYIYGTLNKIGLKQGNKTTKRGMMTALD